MTGVETNLAKLSYRFQKRKEQTGNEMARVLTVDKALERRREGPEK